VHVFVLPTAFLHCTCFKITCLYIPVFPSVHIVNFLFLNQEFMEVSVTLLQISSQPSNVNNGFDQKYQPASCCSGKLKSWLPELTY